MLSIPDNELLTKVGPGTPMGELMRRFWIPALLPVELPEPDCPPVEFRILGEDLVAFRDTAGKIGVLPANCPHRGASLFFGRNEEHGLRCIYHGWKFDVNGNCVDMPNEAPAVNFRDKVKITTYPAVEKGNVIWIYMGPTAELPSLPGFLSNHLPAEHTHAYKRLQASNYMQGLEGGIDPTHAAFLHSSLDTAPRGLPNELMSKHKDPECNAIATEYGVLLATKRRLNEEEDYWRTNNFLMPFYTQAPVDSGDDVVLRWSGWIPIDDENIMRFTVECDAIKPIRENPKFAKRYRETEDGVSVMLEFDGYDPIEGIPGGQFRPKTHRQNNYLLDRNVQRNQRFSGMTDVGTEDQALTETMGIIYDRSREHLGSSDRGIILSRRTLITAARQYAEDGSLPLALENPESYLVHATNLTLPKGADWANELGRLAIAEAGVVPNTL